MHSAAAVLQAPPRPLWAYIKRKPTGQHPTDLIRIFPFCNITI